MKLTCIEMSGFRGVRENILINVPTGFMVLVGRNGSGKSTICDAVEFALSGSIRKHAHKEKGESYDDYVWWRGRGATQDKFVRLTFSDNEGNEIRVERKPNGIDDESRSNLSRLFQTERAPDDPITSICRTSLIRDEEITSLSIDLSEGDRYRFVRDALGNVTTGNIEERIEGVKLLLDKRVSEQRKQYEALRAKVSDLTGRLSETQAAMVDDSGGTYSKEELQEILGVGEDKTDEFLAVARQRLSQHRVQLDRLLNVLTDVQKILDDRKDIESPAFKEKEKQLHEQVVAMEKDRSNLTTNCERLSAQLAEMRKNDPARAQTTELLESGESIGLMPGDACPLCGSNISEAEFSEHITEVRDRLKKEDAEGVRIVREQKMAARQLEDATQATDSLVAQLKKHKSAKEHLDKQLDDATNKALAAGFPIQEDATLNIGELQNHIEKVRDRSQRIEKAVAWLESSSLSEIVESLHRELDDSKNRSKEVYTRLTRAEDAVTKIKNAGKAVRSVLGEVIDEQLSELSPLTEELYKRLRPHIEWSEFRYRMRGNVQRMLSFEVGDGLNPSFLFSSGQRRAVGLSFLLSVHLSRPWCKWQTLVLDDPVQHVDDYRALNLTEVLSAIRKTGRQVICSVEDDALAQLLCRRLRGSGEEDGILVNMHYDREAGVQVEATSVFGCLRSDVLVPA